MRLRRWLLGSMFAALGVCQAFGQTPTLSGIEAPYPAVQSSVKFGGVSYGKGAVAYGPAGTPLILSGKNFGDSGTVQFPGCTVAAPVTSWTPSILLIQVPSCAVTGLVTVSTTVGATVLTSGGWPFMVTSGAYSASMCPAFPSHDQLSITTSSLPDGIVGQSYDATLAAEGGSPPYTWSLTGGSALPAGLSFSASSGAITGTPTAVAGPLSLSVSVTDGMSETDASSLQLTIDAAPSPPSTIYTYLAGYDGDGNVRTYDDSVMGVWSFSYDNLNRLMSATPLPNQQSAYAGQQLCMNYDSFGNRTQSNFQTNACSPASDPATARYNVSNQVTWTSVNVAVNGFAYDAAGNVLNDAENSYVYNAEGKLCAVQTSPITGGTIAYGYIYDAEGRRVARGTITPSLNLNTTPLSCNPATNGFQLIEGYVLGQGGEQLSNYSGNGNWERTNVYGGGQQLATYDIPSPGTAALHFQLTDPLGTRRVQTAADGTAEENCQSLPFGDALNCGNVTGAPATADDANHLHFTGKERDSESGLDYFGARYYGSSIGRFMSPDWADKPEAVPYSSLDNPQSLNLYGYVGNNPLSKADADGHCFPFCLALAGGGVLAEEAPLAAAGPVGFAVIGATAVGVVGYAAYQHFHQEAAAPAEATPTQTPQDRGRANEATGLSEVGADKNTKPVTTVDPKTGQTGTTIPDGKHADGQNVEVKDTQRVTDSKQLRLQNADSKAASGKPSQVVTGENTQVSKTVQQNHEVVRTPKLGPQS